MPIPSKTFKHAGDIGDIIFALPTVRALGGGILYLDPEGGENEPLVGWADKTRTSLNIQSIEWVAPLLSAQPYVTDVRPWHGEIIDYNLDLWRGSACNNNLADSHLAAFKLQFTERERAWLEVAEPIVDPQRTIVVSRSPRVHGNHSFWVDALPRIKDAAVFIGLEKEYEIFEYTFGHYVPFRPVSGVMEMARLIAGAAQYIGNQGFPHSLAEAMKKNLICEYYRVNPMTLFQRPGAQYV